MPPAPQARRILVVDDNLDVAQIMVVLMRGMGHRVEYAINARAALLEARRLIPDFIFLDLNLPDMDGCELARQLKLEPALHATRIFAVTGSGRAEDRQRSLEAGCDDHLLKPVDPAFLESLLGGARRL
ncbi:MAG: response regulator [Pseudomonadota bacterium]|nr:response regulator [Pseudomonadota bacterium]